MELSPLLSALQSDQQLVHDYLDSILAPRKAGSETVIETIRYAVLGSGQRLRPLLALRTGRMLGSDPQATLRAAAAVELVHCASLVIDDLPCMDNSPLRRGRPSTHIVFGEPVAILASFSMVSIAARLSLEGGWTGEALDRARCFQSRLLATLDCGSLVGGQVLDLQLTGESRYRKLEEISELKTVPLFQLAMHAGAAFAPEGTRAPEAALDEFGRQFGRLYQMLDDYLDGELDAPAPLREQFARTREALTRFPRDRWQLEQIVDYLHGKAFQTDHCHR